MALRSQICVLDNLGEQPTFQHTVLELQIGRQRCEPRTRQRSLHHQHANLSPSSKTDQVPICCDPIPACDAAANELSGICILQPFHASELAAAARERTD